MFLLDKNLPIQVCLSSTTFYLVVLDKKLSLFFGDTKIAKLLLNSQREIVSKIEWSYTKCGPESVVRIRKPKKGCNLEGINDIYILLKNICFQVINLCVFLFSTDYLCILGLYIRWTIKWYLPMLLSHCPIIVLIPTADVRGGSCLILPLMVCIGIQLLILWTVHHSKSF